MTESTVERKAPQKSSAPAQASGSPGPASPTASPNPGPAPALRRPHRRRLRIYTLDPSYATQLETEHTSEVTLAVPWERLRRGPVGEYLVVQDKKPLVDLDRPDLVAGEGLEPSEGDPQFHQQMVYAVVMATIAQFERALGRPVLWKHRPNPADSEDVSQFVRRLTVQPHGSQVADASYTREDLGLVFGSFPRKGTPEGAPARTCFTCLSHDLIVHETTHAILDGMHWRFFDTTSPDPMAFHEGLGDIVALLQHFTMTDLLRQEIARTRGRLEAESVLGGLADDFFAACGREDLQRPAIGRRVNGRWERLQPNPADMVDVTEPHARGNLLVATVFDAFLAIYQTRTADLVRIASGGTGRLPEGDMDEDLVRRLADEAAKTATHVLAMCLRALDYTPAVDLTFYEYLRALITADADLVPDDRLNYRRAFVEAFWRHGIRPVDAAPAAPGAAPSPEVETLLWDGLDLPKLTPDFQKEYRAILRLLKAYANRCVYGRGRKALFQRTCACREELQSRLEKVLPRAGDFAEELGIDKEQDFTVSELRHALRTSPGGRVVPQVIVSITQDQPVKADPATGTPAFTFSGGSTLVVDLAEPRIRYRVVKHISSVQRKKRVATYLQEVDPDTLDAIGACRESAEPLAELKKLVKDWARNGFPVRRKGTGHGNGSYGAKRH